MPRSGSKERRGDEVDRLMLGNKICPGQKLALVEAKFNLAMIRRQYSFVVSPMYFHAPAVLMMRSIEDSL
ncbi:Cytochrome P [Trema orientale]|uniref:Cytochrome P n=1 Tax=Trema orientale TaxID=63057 RepID=A0A2P5FZC2_TREOI|nr:Cytochrome P [Trema orientale]